MKRNFSDIILVSPAILSYTVFMVIPILLCFFFSFTNWNGLSPNYKIIGLRNFIELLKDDSFFNALKNTLIITILTTVIFNILGILLAVIIEGAGRVSRFCKSAVFIPTILSSVVVAFIWSYMIQTDGGVINSVFGLVGIPPVDFYRTPLTTIFMISVIISWQGLGFYTTIYVASLSTIPEEIYEAGKVDGASRISGFFNITLPLLIPGITLNSILSVIGGLKQFDIVKVITNGGPGNATQTITINALEKATDYNMRGYSSAIVFVMFLMIIIVSMLQLKYLKKFEVKY